MEVTPNLEIGGAQETARTLAKYLPQVGCPTIVATFGDGPLRNELEDSGVIVERLPARRHSIVAGPLFVTEMIARRRDLRRLIDRYDVDVIQTQGLGTLDFLVMTLVFGDRVKVWWTIQNANFLLREEHLTRFKWLLRPKRAAHRAMYRLGLRAVDGVIAVSTDTERSFRESLGLNGHPIDVVCNAVDVELFPPRVLRDEVRSQLGLNPSDHVMTMVGTFKRQKGHSVLIDALADAKDRLPHLKIILVGDGELRNEIATSVRTHGLEDRVHFLGSRRDVPQILAASDSFILPSLWEGLPVALVEAMASGLPVIATSVSGTSEVMDDGVTGWVVPAGDASALKTAMLDLVADPQRAARMGVAGRECVEARFSALSQAESLASIFRESSSSRSYA
ncbi:MAG: glycosyltransferase family 4 protein [Actinobacteria bacterium]|nr:glycosyltransferase family 4 protein [Actinomycetota bacterium]